MKRHAAYNLHKNKTTTVGKQSYKNILVLVTLRPEQWSRHQTGSIQMLLQSHAQPSQTI